MEAPAGRLRAIDVVVPTASAPGDERGAAPAGAPAGRRPLVVPAVAVALVGLHLWLSADIPGPSLLWDGQGYLGNARWLAGHDPQPWLGPLAFYHAGYSLLLAPLYWILDQPGDIFRGALVVNAGAAGLGFVALHHLARSAFGLDRPRAVAAAAVASLYPPVLLQSGFEWGESAFAAAFAGAALLAWRCARRPSAAVAVALGAATAGLHLLHPRALGVSLATLALLAALVATRRLRWGEAVAGVAALATGLVGVEVLHAALRRAIYADPDADIQRRVLRRLVEPSLWDDLLLRAAGQVWYLLVATVGVAAVGIALLAVTARWGRTPAHRLLAGWLLLATAAVLGASALQMAERARVDQLVYGRYLDGVVPVLLVAGVAGVLGARPRRATVATAAAGVGATAALVVVLHAGHGDGAFTGTVAAINVLGLVVFDRADPGHLDVAGVTAAAVIAMVVVALLAHRWPRAAVAALAVAALAVTVDLDHRVTGPFAEEQNRAYVLGPVIGRIRADAVAVDLGAYDMLGANRYQFQNLDVPFTFTRDPAAPGGPDVVVASKAWPEGRAAGARMVFPEPSREQALWVLPGRRQDRLARAGFLVLDPGGETPPGFGEAVLGVDPARPRVRPGGSLAVTVRVRHAGRAAPWVSAGSIAEGDAGGRVAIVARVEDAARRPLTADVSFELPRTLLPGDAVSVPIRIPPVAALAPGERGRLVIELVRPGVGPFASLAVPVRASSG